MQTVRIEAEPSSIDLDLSQTGLVIVDMQHDFLRKGGYAADLGLNVGALQRVTAPILEILAEVRRRHMQVVYTREGYRRDLSDVPHSWLSDAEEGLRIGDRGKGEWSKLIWGEKGAEIIDELQPQPGDIVVRKAGKDAFHHAKPNLERLLRKQRIENLLFTGITTGVCVGTSVRSANNRGFRCVVVEDGVADYDQEIHRAELKNIAGRDQAGKRGVFGWVTDSESLLQALENGD